MKWIQIPEVNLIVFSVFISNPKINYIYPISDLNKEMFYWMQKNSPTFFLCKRGFFNIISLC